MSIWRLREQKKKKEENVLEISIQNKNETQSVAMGQDVGKNAKQRFARME